jgi:hypothetical protein
MLFGRVTPAPEAGTLRPGGDIMPFYRFRFRGGGRVVWREHQLPDDHDAYCWGADELERSYDLAVVDIWRGDQMIASHWSMPVSSIDRIPRDVRLDGRAAASLRTTVTVPVTGGAGWMWRMSAVSDMPAVNGRGRQRVPSCDLRDGRDS